MTTQQPAADLSTMTPAEIDALWLPLQEAESLAEQRAEQYADMAASDRHLPYIQERYAADAARYQREADEAQVAQIPFQAEWNRRGGWTRAYLAVTNGNGHVHSSMNCSTCNRMGKATGFYPLAEVSGLDLAEIIDLAGERACTVCYPGAPVSVLQQATRLFSKDEIKAKAEREAREADRAAKAAAKAAKAIMAADGGKLRDQFNGEIKTERTAWNTLIEIIFDHFAYGYGEHAEIRDAILAALVAKSGKTDLAIREEIRAKVQAKAKREGILVSKIKF